MADIISGMSKAKQALIPAPIPAAKEEPLKNYGLVELFGRQRLVGFVTVDPPEFPGMVKVDVPDLLKDGKVVRQGFTRYFGRGALYGITPISREIMLQLLPGMDSTPARPLALGSYKNGRDYDADSDYS